MDGVGSGMGLGSQGGGVGAAVCDGEGGVNVPQLDTAGLIGPGLDLTVEGDAVTFDLDDGDVGAVGVLFECGGELGEDVFPRGGFVEGGDDGLAQFDRPVDGEALGCGAMTEVLGQVVEFRLSEVPLGEGAGGGKKGAVSFGKARCGCRAGLGLGCEAIFLWIAIVEPCGADDGQGKKEEQQKMQKLRSLGGS